MKVPLKIVFRNVSPYEDAVEAEVRRLADKLETYYPRIVRKEHIHHRRH